MLVAPLEVASVDPAFRTTATMALPTDDGTVAPLERCVFNDSPWLLRRMRPGALHMTSLALGSALRERLGVRDLSAVLVEEPPDDFQPAPVEEEAARALTAKLRSADTAAAIAALLAVDDARRSGWSAPPPRHLRAEAVRDSLAPLSVRIVACLPSRLRMLPAREDVTVDEATPEDAPWLLHEQTVLLLAEPPPGLTHEYLLGLALCEHSIA